MGLLDYTDEILDSESIFGNIEERYKIQYRSGSYIPPSKQLLKNYTSDDVFMNKDRSEALASSIVDICTSFKVGVSLTDVEANDMAITVSLLLNPGVSVKSIKALKAELELYLASRVEFYEDDEGSERIQILIKNEKRPLVGLKSIIESKQFENAKSPLSIAVGVDVHGKPVVVDIAKTPHLLIAGTTGSGKSVFVDDLLISLLYKASPEEVRLLLIDPKVVELQLYNGIPHLLMPVISDVDKALSALFWVEDEMLRRYQYFSDENVKNIDSYNLAVEKKGKTRLPLILIVVDEFSELMMKAAKDTSVVVGRIARMGRAAGVHLVIATQLPVSKIVTPQIKSNIPCRASFTVVDGRESRIILDKTGAERLLGSGDMIFSKSDKGGAIHAQAAYVSETELHDIVDYIMTRN